MPRLRCGARASSAGRARSVVPVRLLLDENLSERLVSALADCLPDVLHVRLVGLGGAHDAVIWTYAMREDRLLVTKDEDFIAMSVVRGAPPKVVWLNIGNAGTAATAAVLRAAVEDIAAFAVHPEATFLALSFGPDSR